MIEKPSSILHVIFDEKYAAVRLWLHEAVELLL